MKISAQRGHEIFSLILDKLSCILSDDTESLTNCKHLVQKEQSQFKLIVEEIQLKLTSPTIESKSFSEQGIEMFY